MHFVPAQKVNTYKPSSLISIEYPPRDDPHFSAQIPGIFDSAVAQLCCNKKRHIKQIVLIKYIFCVSPNEIDILCAGRLFLAAARSCD